MQKFHNQIMQYLKTKNKRELIFLNWCCEARNTNRAFSNFVEIYISVELRFCVVHWQSCLIISERKHRGGLFSNRVLEYYERNGSMPYLLMNALAPGAPFPNRD